MEVKDKQTVRHKERHPLFKATNRMMVFCTLFVLVAMFLYVTGSASLFMDSTIMVVLNVLQTASWVCLFFCLLLLVQIVVFSVYFRDRTYLRGLPLALLALVVSLAGFTLSGVVRLLAAGV